jgi:exonuclease SbcD
MKPFTFVHAADLHIGSPFKGLSAESPLIARALSEATLKAYNNVVNAAIESQASFAVIAGDVYDGLDRSIHSQLAFIEGLAQLSDKGIASYIAHGNHDPLDGWSSAIEIPSHAHVFGDRVESFTATNLAGEPIAHISGISYPHSQVTRNLSKDFKAPTDGPDLFKIAVLHCHLAGDTTHANYAPCTIEELAGAGFNYWALGHVHLRQVVRENPWVVYPGNTQGRHIREDGARGCYVVTVNSPTDVRMEFIPTDTIRWFSAAVSIDNLSSLNELETRVSQTLDELAKQAENRALITRLELTGRGALYQQLQQPRHLDEFLEHCRSRMRDLSPLRWIEQIDFHCKPEIDFDEARQRDDLTAFVLREAHSLAQTDLQTALAPVLAPLYQHAQASKYLSTPEPEALRKLLDEASLLCYDKLENG